MSVTWITPHDTGVGGVADWTDIDVSDVVPAGATGVILHTYESGGFGASFGIRKNGSTDARLSAYNFWNHQWYAIGVDANRIIEYKSNNVINILVVGYFSDESVFFTNGVDKTLGSTGSYLDVDISSDTGVDTAICVFMEVVTVYDKRIGIRKNGSTDDFYTYIYSRPYPIYSVALDANEIFEAKVEDTGYHMYLLGYMKSGATLNTNLTDVSLGSIDSYVDLSALSAGATGGFIFVTSVFSASNYALRKNGSSEDIYWGLYTYGVNAYVECDVSQLIEGKIASTGTDFYLIGYTTAGGGLSIPLVEEHYRRNRQ